MFFSAPAAEALAAPTACLTPSRVASCSSETWALTGIVTHSLSILPSEFGESEEPPDAVGVAAATGQKPSGTLVAFEPA